MVLYRVWFGMILVSLIVGFSKLLFWQDTFILQKMLDSLFESARTSMELSVFMAGTLCLWMGIMKVGEDGGAVRVMSRAVYPLFSRLFPEIPKNHPAMGSIMLNFSANMLGLDNAATPAGLRAMGQLQELNPDKTRASNAQIMFLVLNASGLTIIPVSILAARDQGHSLNPAAVFVPILITTYFATLAGLLFVAIRQRINLFNGAVFAYLGTLTGLICLLLYFVMHYPEYTDTISRVLSTVIIFGFIAFFIIMAIRSRIVAYESFYEGAKDGFQVALNILPILVTMLAAIGLFKTSGALPDLISGLKWLLVQIGVATTQFADALPVWLMKPFSGSAAKAMMVQNMQSFGPDSFVSNLSATFQGSTETTFYVIAVYFGSVKITNTRYAATAGLFCDLIGGIVAIFVAYLFFR